MPGLGSGMPLLLAPVLALMAAGPVAADPAPADADPGLSGTDKPSLRMHLSLIPAALKLGWTGVPARCSPDPAQACPVVGPLAESAETRALVAPWRLSGNPADLPFWTRLDSHCQGSAGGRCAWFSLAVGVHGASANLQWRVDGAQSLTPGREFAHDGLHVRFQASYALD